MSRPTEVPRKQVLEAPGLERRRLIEQLESPQAAYESLPRKHRLAANTRKVPRAGRIASGFAASTSPASGAKRDLHKIGGQSRIRKSKTALNGKGRFALYPKSLWNNQPRQAEAENAKAAAPETEAARAGHYGRRNSRDRPRSGGRPSNSYSPIKGNSRGERAIGAGPKGCARAGRSLMRKSCFNEALNVPPPTQARLTRCSPQSALDRNPEASWRRERQAIRRSRESAIPQMPT